MALVTVRKFIGTLALAAAVVASPGWAQFSDGYNFLKAVRERNGTDATKLLSEPGSTLINSRDQATDETALHIVVQRRDELWTKFLLERGANPNLANKSKVTPLALAASLGFVEGVELLIKKGARVDVPNAAGETPLISAVHRRDLALVRLLIKHGANLDRPDNSGRSARDYAMLMGASAGVAAAIESAEADKKGSSPKDSFGPVL
jgi:uncharacterized protein